MSRPTIDINDDPRASHYTVDGIFQGDRVRNTRTGETGKVTFASRQHESHVNVDGKPPTPSGPYTEIWDHSEIDKLSEGS